MRLVVDPKIINIKIEKQRISSLFFILVTILQRLVFLESNLRVMQELNQVVDQIENKVLELVGQLQELKSENGELKRKNEELRILLETEKKRNLDLEEQNKVAKIAKSVTLSDDDRKVQRKRLNEMVREIDKCIALINN
jgi:chromosome segregation ATPase